MPGPIWIIMTLDQYTTRHTKVRIVALLARSNGSICEIDEFYDLSVALAFKQRLANQGLKITLCEEQTSTTREIIWEEKKTKLIRKLADLTYEHGKKKLDAGIRNKSGEAKKSVWDRVKGKFVEKKRQWFWTTIRQPYTTLYRNMKKQFGHFSLARLRWNLKREVHNGW